MKLRQKRARVALGTSNNIAVVGSPLTILVELIFAAEFLTLAAIELPRQEEARVVSERFRSSRVMISLIEWLERTINVSALPTQHTDLYWSAKTMKDVLKSS